MVATSSKSSGGIFLLLTLYLIFKCLNNVVWKVVMNELPSYPYVLGTLQSILYLPLYWGASVVLSTTSSCASAKLIPRSKYAVIGSLNAAGTVLLFVGNSPLITGSKSVLLSQLMIPFSMIISSIVFVRGYNRKVKLAVAVILLGVLISVWPQLDAPSTSSFSSLYPITVFTVGIFALAASNVYCEAVLTVYGKGEETIDMTYFWASCCNYQVLFQLIAFPLAFPLQSISVSDGFTNFVSGLQCLGGYQPHGNEVDQCSGSIVTFLAYQCVNSIYNLQLVYIIAVSNATYLNVVTTLSIPLSNFMFATELVS
jgi:hypothetical protein